MTKTYAGPTLQEHVSRGHPVCGQGDNGSTWRVSAKISFRAFAFTYRSANAQDPNAAGLRLSWAGLSGLSNICDGSVFCQP